MNEFPAHIRLEQDCGRSIEFVQSVQEHCRHTAEYAGSALEKAGLYHAAYLVGLIHDSGKFTEMFSRYIRKAVYGETVQKGSVNHTFTGCRMLLEHFHGEKSRDYRDVTAELLAYAVGAHHGQFDCIDEKGKSGFMHRMEKKDIGYEESKENYLNLCADWPELEVLFDQAQEELTPIYETINTFHSDEQVMFSLGQLARLLLSSVIEGDRRDTAEFMNGRAEAECRKDMSKLWMERLDYMEQKLGMFPQDTPIQIARRRISDLCRKAAERPGGIYRLNVPTGGGKTLSSLRYALAHAAKWGKSRIFFVTPLLTILEQNAAVLREFIGDDGIILEHHSNALDLQGDKESLDLRELAVDSWNEPIVITTLVQLLNTMFLGKTTSIRRYQALCDAVVIIDEVQTVPNHMLSLFNTAVNFLSVVCGTTFVLCSATQPCFEEAVHPLMLNQTSELIPYKEDLWRPFQRTVIKDAGSMRLEEVPSFVQNVLKTEDSLLIICNKKAESELLFQHLRGQENCFHLSSAMCMAHRRETLKRMEASLEEGRRTGRKTICVSTQVMEAGVDISFRCVIRLAAGMDRVVQAAGRCNRNGESQNLTPVYIVQCVDENLSRLREIRAEKQATIALLEQYRRSPDLFDEDLASQKSVEWYYRKLYRDEEEGYQDFSVKLPESGKRTTLFEMLSWNDDFTDDCTEEAERYSFRQAFRTAGTLFRVLDDSAADVVVPYGEGKKLIELLECMPQPIPVTALKDWLRRAKPYTVSIYEYQKAILQDRLRNIQGILVLGSEYYNDYTGLTLNPEGAFLEV